MNKFCLKKDTPDNRDLPYRTRMFTLPTKVDLRQFCSPVENQGQIGSCTANALVGNLEFLEKKEKLPFTDLSRLFIYYNERFIEQTVNEDSGASLRDGIKALKTYGVCPEKLWPYETKFLYEKPNDQAYQEASKHRVSAYERIKSLDEMKDCLASGVPFVFGIQVFESFESQSTAQTGIVPMPSSSERLLGGHALLAVGYDDLKEQVIIRNSWGEEWGVKGYGYIPYRYLESTLAQDFWAVQKL